MVDSRRLIAFWHRHDVALAACALGIVGLTLVLERWLRGGASGIDVLLNIGSELIGIALTVLVIDFLVRRSEWRREKSYWLRELGSPFRFHTERAARELRARGWLEDGSLRRCVLITAHLEGISLSGADLEGAEFLYANLAEAQLGETKLAGANFLSADLHGANLEDADLHKAKLVHANLRGAHLRRAKLEEADLTGADLRDADLTDANFDWATLNHANLQGAKLKGPEIENSMRRGTTLPDGSSL